MAYAIARARPSWRPLLLMLVILPFWTSFLIRVYAWMGLLAENGILNQFLRWSGLVADPGTILGTEWAVHLGIVYAYLPFMVLPLYAALEKLDTGLLEAAADLGATPVAPSCTVTLPLSLPGIVAGCLLVFIPAVGEFVIPDLLGGTDTLMIGKVLWDEFFANTRLAARLGGGDLPAGPAGRADRAVPAPAGRSLERQHDDGRARFAFTCWPSATPSSTCRSRW